MRVVLDTSVFLSALLWRGKPHRLLELAESGTITLCVTADILAELREVLSRPKFAARLAERRTTVGEIMEGVLRLAELYPAGQAVGSVPADPDDEIFVAGAVSAGAAYIITGDQHLLNIGQHGTTAIATPKEFLDKEFPEQADPA